MRVPSSAQRGFTLVETLVALALLSTIVIATTIGLTHRAGEVEASREQAVAFLAMAKAHATTIGDARVTTGATVVATYDPAPQDATTLALFDGRPFGGATIAPAARVAVVRVAGRVALDATEPNDAPNSFAIFIGTSGTTSALAGYDVNRTSVPVEPPCDYDTGISLSFVPAEGEVTLACANGETVPAPSATAR